MNRDGKWCLQLQGRSGEKGGEINEQGLETGGVQLLKGSGGFCSAGLTALSGCSVTTTNPGTVKPQDLDLNQTNITGLMLFHIFLQGVKEL